LSNYASHVYNWNTPNGRKKLRDKIKELLLDIKQNPEKTDNPVSDFLQERPVYRSPSKQELVNVIEYDDQGVPHIVISPKELSLANVIGLILYASAEQGLGLSDLTSMVSSNWKRVPSTHVSATLGSMKGLIIKEGKPGNYLYRLSGKGRVAIFRLVESLSQD
jgi:hypothetical protein